MLPHCAQIAESAYHVPTSVLETVAAHRQSGLGIMGIDEGWLPALAHAGFDIEAVRSNACWNIIAAAWIIAGSRPNQLPEETAARPQFAKRSPSLPGSMAGCITDASTMYHVPEAIFRAVLLTEGGAQGTISHNKNGTDDLGVAQINTSWLPRLAAAGVTRERLLTDSCLNIHVGAWILGRELDGATLSNAGDFWRRVGNYNSHTERFNRQYQARVWSNLQHMASRESAPTP